MLEDRVTPATFVVNSIADSGPGTLRAAVTAANSKTGADVIVFDTAGVFASPQTIDLKAALPSISENLTITGPGASQLTVRRSTDGGTPQFRLFSLAGAGPLSLSGMTLTNGDVSDDGGAIQITGGGGLLELNEVLVTGNKAGNDGGAISVNANAFVAIRNSTISGNTAGSNGGGVYFYFNGSLLVENSTISGNSAAGTAGGDPFNEGGGGVYFYGAASASPPPGFTAGALVVRNSTIHGNTTGKNGGGIMVVGFSGTLQVQNSTITGNSATATTPGGGGIGQSYGAGPFVITSSVVAENTNTAGPDIRSTGTVTVNNSAIGSATGFTLTGSNNIPFGTPLLLGPLQDNGGFSPTRLPQAGSPLIGKGSNPVNLTTDQRGWLRTFNTTVDIGATEVQPAPTVVSFVANPAGPTNSGLIDYTITFNMPMTGLTAANFALVAPGLTASIGTPVANASSTQWTIPVTVAAGVGTVQVNMVNATGVRPLPGPDNLPFNGPTVVVDRVAPTLVSITRNPSSPNPAPPGTASLDFNVTFDEPVTGLTPANFQLAFTGNAAATITGLAPAGNVWTVTVTGISGDGDIGLNMVSAAGVNDLVGNPLSTNLPFAGDRFVVGRPLASSLVTGTTGPTNADSLTYTLTFNQPVDVLNVSNFDLMLTPVPGGSVTGVIGTPVKVGNGTTWTIPVTGIDGDGTLGLRLNNNTATTPEISDIPLPLAGTVVTIDNTNPFVTATTRLDPSPTKASSVRFQVVFSEAVTGLTAGHFTTLTTGSLAVGAPTLLGSGTTYTVTVPTLSGDGTLRLIWNSGAGVTDAAGNPATGFPFVDGEAYTVDRVSPTVQIALLDPDPTNLAFVRFQVTFNEIVSGVTQDNFVLASTVGSAVITDVTQVGPRTYTVTVGTGAGDGKLGVNVVQPQTILDWVGNPMAAPFVGPQYTVVKTPPAVLSIARLNPSPTAAQEVAFTVTFSAPVTGVDASDFAFAISGAFTPAILSVTGSGSSYVVLVAVPGTGDGTVRLNLVDNDSIVDQAGNPLGGPGLNNGNLNGEAYALDRSAPVPTVGLSAGQSATIHPGDVARFRVVFSEQVTGFDANDVSVSGAATFTSVTVTGTGTTYEITVLGIGGLGTLSVAVPAGAALDTSGNESAASNTASVTVTPVPPPPNRPPVANPDVYPGASPTAALVVAAPGVLGNDTDVNGDPLTAVLVTPPPASAGTLVLNPDGSFTFTPTLGFSGQTSFTYAATDGTNTSAPATVTIVVAPRVALTATAAGPGGGPHVTVYNPDGTPRFSMFAYEVTFTGGVTIATGDVNGDGVDDIICGPASKGGPIIRVFNGATGVELGSFFAYAPTFRGGVFVASADVNGDGLADIITGAGPGGGPHVQVWSGADFSSLKSFFAYDPAFKGGVNVAAGDLNGDRRAEIVTAPASRGGPHVQVFDGFTGVSLTSFFAYDPSYAGGLNVAIGDVNDDTQADLIVAGGRGPNVRFYLAGTSTLYNEFIPNDLRLTGGARVSVKDLNGDLIGDELVLASGPGGSPVVSRFDLPSLTSLGERTDYPVDFMGGIFIG